LRGPGSKRPPLKRTMSSWALKNKLPKPLPPDVKRQFFRTWVRVVRRDNLGDFGLEGAALAPEGTREDYMRYRRYLASTTPEF